MPWLCDSTADADRNRDSDRELGVTSKSEFCFHEDGGKQLALSTKPPYTCCLACLSCTSRAELTVGVFVVTL